jgi:hypothetical protein
MLLIALHPFIGGVSVNIHNETSGSKI